MFSHHRQDAHETDRSTPGVSRAAEVGASLVEYALLLALIAIVCVGAVGYFGGASGGSLDRSGDCIKSSQSGTPRPDCN